MGAKRVDTAKRQSDRLLCRKARQSIGNLGPERSSRRRSSRATHAVSTAMAAAGFGWISATASTPKSICIYQVWRRPPLSRPRQASEIEIETARAEKSLQQAAAGDPIKIVKR
jgi:hypothetical protein